MLGTNFKNKNGFSLVEIIVAVGLFTVVATVSIGAILSVFDANKRSQSSKTVVDTLNLALEDMARSIRFGTVYHCGSGGTLTEPENCTNGDDFIAVNFEGATIVYRKNGNTIQKSSNGGTGYSTITATNVVIQNLDFYVFGATDNPSIVQPYVIAVIKGYVGSKPTQQSVFSIQTVMSQRILDL